MHRRPDTRPPGARSGRPARLGRDGDERGTALVEFALVLPLIVLLVGIAFNGWDAMQTSIRLTSAARAGAIAAANALGAGYPQNTAQTDATTAIDQEEGSGSNLQAYVTVSPPQTETLSGTTISTVTVTISPSPITLIPFVEKISVATHATARFS
jgi:Flp pilus assembly protein TadG